MNYTNRRVQAVVIIAYMHVIKRKKTLALQWFLPPSSVNILLKVDFKAIASSMLNLEM